MTVEHITKMHLVVFSACTAYHHRSPKSFPCLHGYNICGRFAHCRSIGKKLTVRHMGKMPKEWTVIGLFTHADDFKVVGTNAITLQIDAHIISRRCQLTLMNLNLQKSALFCLKGNMSINLNNHRMITVATEKAFGRVVSSDLDWHAQAERRVAKSMQAFYKVKSNISQSTPWNSKLMLYRSYIVPIPSND